ncbi:MAG TPA: CDP-diacylglycerol--glycerol-3-phosphate 3-phosphatidyltransferase [Candidatus Limnocylindria bacterium]|nr:CDP-diacylglycerol--glycerol-3-phosphate 3-phosphatidyltransferase [Candidatus Limnocylindria bacterium]
MTLNLPLLLVFARMLAVIPIVVLLGTPTERAATIAFAVFCVAALTDAIDGRLARRYGQVTRLGTFLDPLADKLLVIGTLIPLQALGVVPAWIVVLVVARELVVTNLRAIASARGYSVGASVFGKVKTILQTAATAGLLLVVAAPSLPLALLAYSLLAAAVALTVLSGADYLWKASFAIAGRGVPEPWRIAARDRGARPRAR